MTLKYESELLFDLMKRDGDDAPSDVLPYESELKEKYLNQVLGAYPKLQDYRAEWLNYNLNFQIPSDFPVESVTNVTSASFNNVVPDAYERAILKGKSETIDGTLQSVKSPVLTTTGKNLFDKTKITPNKLITGTGATTTSNGNAVTDYIPVEAGKTYIKNKAAATIAVYDTNKNFIERKKAGTTFSATANGYIRWNFNSYASVLDTMQIEEGSVATEYEPYKSNILTTPEDLELRGIGDVRDTLDCLTGKLTQRIGEDGAVLSQEVVKTIDLTVTDQDGNTESKIRPIEGTMHVNTSSQTLPPLLDMGVPVEATTQNLMSFANIEVEE